MTAANIRDRHFGVQVALEEIAEQGVSFEIARVSDVPLDGTARYRTYTSADAAANDLAASEIDQDTYDAIAAALGQSPRPARVHIIRVNVSGSEGYDEALSDAVDQGLDFYFVALDSRTAADQLDVSAWCESRRKLCVLQSSDADWLTAGVPSAYSTITTRTRTAVIYHPTDSQQADVGWLGRVSAINPDLTAPSFEGPVAGVTAYSLTDTEAGHAIDNHCAILLPPSPGASTRWIDPSSAVAVDGERLYARLTMDWLADRCETALLQAYMNAVTGGGKFPLDGRGEAIALGRVVGVAQRGLTAGHFVQRDDLPDGYDLATSIDVPTRTIHITGQVGLLDGVESIATSVVLTRGA